MPASSNFQQAIREAQSRAIVGPNVVNKALPYNIANLLSGKVSASIKSSCNVYGINFDIKFCRACTIFCLPQTILSISVCPPSMEQGPCQHAIGRAEGPALWLPDPVRKLGHSLP